MIQLVDRIRYKLKSKTQRPLKVTEPLGWQSDEKELSRHETYHGIVSKFSNNLKFIGSGKDYIFLTYELEGINAEIELIREEKHPQTDLWTLTYSGYLDLSTISIEKNELSIKFNSGGLEQALKARETEQLEIDRLTTIDGKTLPELQTIEVPLLGRRIFLKSKWKVEPSEETDVYLNNQTDDKNERGDSTPVPFKIINQSHEEAQQPIQGLRVGDNSQLRTGNGETGLMFFAIADRDKVLRVRFDLTFTIQILEYEDINNFSFWVNLKKYSGGINYNFKENTTLYYGNVPSISGDVVSVSFDQDIELLKGESLSLLFEQFMRGDSNFTTSKLLIVEKDITANLYLDEDSSFEATTTDAILAHEAVDRLTSIATNRQKSFYSDFLGRTDLGYSANGKGAFNAITHGFWIRGFDKLPLPTENEPNLFKPLTTSFKDFVDSIDAVWNIGIGIEKIGVRERVRLEELSYFYNLNVLIRLPNQVKDVKRSIATEYYFSSLEFGSEKGGTYEEAFGLDEYNKKNTYTTVINRVKGIYSKLSKYRTDSYGMEFARRKQANLNDTEDTAYDTEVFLMDLFDNGLRGYNQRLWQQDFEKEPSGVFSPDTATNLRFSPFNCLLRHSWYFSNCLQKYLMDYTRYASSESNSQLTTKLFGKPEYAENGNIINSELNRARFIPEWIEFSHECTFEIMHQVEGFTTIKGKEIRNFYGLVEFINENNVKEKGFLFNLKPNGKGSWKILKLNN